MNNKSSTKSFKKSASLINTNRSEGKVKKQIIEEKPNRIKQIVSKQTKMQAPSKPKKICHDNTQSLTKLKKNPINVKIQS